MIIKSKILSSYTSAVLSREEKTIDFPAIQKANVERARCRLGDIPPWNVLRNVPAGIDWY
jgi:hypothetical protein